MPETRRHELPGPWLVPVILIAATFASHPQATAQQFTKIEHAGPITTDAFLSTGASWNDINNDGLPDLFVLGESANHFYINNGDSTFTALDAGHFLTPLGVGNAGIWADFDNDGDLDMYLTNFVTEPGGTQLAPNVLYRNTGAPSWEMEVVDIGNALNASPSGSWVDYDQDGDVDLFSAGGFISQSGSPTIDLFYRNDGDGVFTRTRELPLLKRRGGAGTHDTWVDYDNDGDADFYVVNWRFPNELYKSLLVETGNPNLFERVANSGLTSDGGILDIGSAWGDYDNDGDFDMFLPVANNADRLYRNDGDGTFTRITGTPIGGKRSVIGAWADYDNDGDLDLYAGSGAPALYRNEGDGTFVAAGSEAGDILAPPPSPQAGNWADYDNDGDLDLYILTYAVPSNRTGVPQANVLLRNNAGSSNHWLEIRLEGVLSNRSAIGATLRLKTTAGDSGLWQSRFVSGGATAFVFSGELRVHFGLGTATRADSIVISWPSGIVQVVENIPADQMLTVVEEIPDGFLRSNFYADVTSASGMTQFEVSFTDVSLADPARPVTSWAWDFDDNGTVDSAEPDPKWTYNSQRDTTWSVRLRTSNGDTTSELVREMYITMDGIVTALDEPQRAAPATFSLAPNFPNPFNPATTIRYDLRAASHVQMEIYNTVGEKIRVLFAGDKAPGSYAVVWDGRDKSHKVLPSGVYVLRMTAGGSVFSQKLMLLK